MEQCVGVGGAGGTGDASRVGGVRNSNEIEVEVIVVPSVVVVQLAPLSRIECSGDGSDSVDGATSAVSGDVRSTAACSGSGCTSGNVIGLKLTVWVIAVA